MNLTGTDLNPFRTKFSVRPFAATLQPLHLVLTNDFLVCVMRATRLAGRTFIEFVHRNIWRLPVVLYGCETWPLTLREERKLRVFENMVLRRIFGPRRDEVMG